MKFLELNKNVMRFTFTDKPVDPKDARTAIEIATWPRAHNSQPPWSLWLFVIENAELAKLAYGSN